LLAQQTPHIRLILQRIFQFITLCPSVPNRFGKLQILRTSL
jgi:hypothetical protein